MNKKYKFSLITILVMIAFTIYIGLDYQNYLSNLVIVDELLVLPSSDISINYELGNEIDYTKNTITKTFTVTNIKDESISWNINLVNNTEIKEQNEATIEIKENGNTILTQEIVLDSYNEVMTNIPLENNTTNEYTITINCENANATGKLHINTIEQTENDFANDILDNTIVSNPITIPGVEASTEDEGLIKISNNNKDTYYFRGLVENNYVTLANYKWRIISIESNGDVKLILDEELGDLNSFYSKEELIYSKSNAYVILNEWYNQILLSYDDSIEMMNTTTESTLEDNLYLSNIRLTNNELNKPVGEISESKISLISADEIIYAGGLLNKNSDSYLNNENNINYILTNTLSYYKNNASYLMALDPDTGKLTTINASLNANLRPVITINKNITSTGSGTVDDPYVLK